MHILRQEYKSQAKKNEELFKEIIEPDFLRFWSFVEICNERVNTSFKCVNDSCPNSKEFFLILMLRNSISDLLHCVDSLERGHGNTILNNLRMILEGLCLAFYLYQDKTNDSFYRYKNNKNDTNIAQVAINFCKKYDGYESFGQLYGILSEISHHANVEQTVHKIDRASSTIHHINPINVSQFKLQANPLLMIMFMFRAIAELAEGISIDLIEEPYFVERRENALFSRKLNLKEDEFMQKFGSRLASF